MTVTIQNHNTTTPTKISFDEGDCLTIAKIVAGELKNWGYEVTEPQLVYEPTWGESRLQIEVKGGGS